LSKPDGKPATKSDSAPVMHIDATGLRCPMPVLKLQKALKSLGPGARLTLTATDPASYIDVRHFCEANGHELLSAEEADGVFTYEIAKGNG
jgi:tRNA 2-thiouridine synthesizing protein A